MTKAEEIVKAGLDHFISKDWDVVDVSFDENDNYHIFVKNVNTLDTFEIPEIETDQSLPKWVWPIVSQIRLYFGRFPRGAST